MYNFYQRKAEEGKMKRYRTINCNLEILQGVEKVKLIVGYFIKQKKFAIASKLFCTK
jgi:hypothetical protein